MQGVDKAFPGVQALRGAHLSVAAGEVHVLLGENGAGKSTLMKILSGQYPPDAGTITLDGVPFAPRSPRDASRHGIAIIHQELSSILPLTVAENVLLGDEPARGGVIDRATELRRAQALLDQIGARVDPRARAAELSVAELQLVEIAKALRHEARVLIMDEPTAALTGAETERLHEVIRGLCARGVSVVYISHRMPEIFAIGDRVTVLRDGATVTTVKVAETTVADLITAMVGRPLVEIARGAKRQPAQGAVALRVAGLRRGRIGPIDLEVRQGEIFGLGGLMGAGRTEVARAIFGADAASGEVFVGERRLAGTVRDAIDAGVGFVTEDRKAQGLVLDASAAANISLAALAAATAGAALSRAGVIDLAGEAALAERARERLRIKLPSVRQATRALSGGNQQKVIIARWLATQCRVLLLDEPTRGVDVGAKAEIYEVIAELAAAGVALLLISSDMPELLGLSDRVGVMREGQLQGVLARADATPERVMALAVASPAV